MAEIGFGVEAGAPRTDLKLATARQVSREGYRTGPAIGRKIGTASTAVALQLVSARCYLVLARPIFVLVRPKMVDREPWLLKKVGLADMILPALIFKRGLSDMLTTGNQLRAARALGAISQAQLAKAAGINVTTISAMEGKGAAVLGSGLDTIKAVMDALDAAGIELLDNAPGVRLKAK